MSEVDAIAPGAPREEPWLSTLLRVLVHAIGAAVIAYPLGLWNSVAAAAAGAGLGSYLARYFAASALRLPAVVLLTIAAMLGVLGLEWLVVDLPYVPQALGPAGALSAGDGVVFGLGAFVVSTGLRTLSIRRPAFTILEVALVAGGFATLLVAHRNGAIHRPYELADPMISRGEDPTLAILGIGAAGAAVIGLLLLSERSLLRSALHLGVVAVLLLLILWTTTMTGLPTPPSTGGALGLSDDDSEAQGGGSGSGSGSGGQRSSDELDFLDQYPSGGAAPDAVVIFHDDYSPPGGYYYFRQNAFSQFNGRKLVAAMRRGVDEDVRNHFPTNRARDVAWSPGAGTDRTTVETTVAMLADNSAPLGLEAPERFVPATNPSPERFRRMYRVHSTSLTSEPGALLGRPAGDPTWDDETRAHYLEGPDDPRYRALAERIVATLPEHLREEPIAKALAITHYLGENGTYSLRSRHAGHEDPTAHFLFGDLTGYCVHFAHAAVFLMRAVGVPARVGTGYALPEANRQGGSALLLRNSDQHAWPEVYLGPGEPMPTPERTAVDAYVAMRDEGMLDFLPAMLAERLVEAVEETARAELPSLPPSSFEDDVGSEDEGEVTGLEAEARLAQLAEALEITPDALLDATRARYAPEETEGPGAGWVVTDVAPENVLDASGEPPDPQLQQLLGELARGSQPIDDAPQPPRPMSEAVRAVATPTLIGLAALVPLALVIGYGVKLWRSVAPLFAREADRPRVLYRAALDRLSEDGLRRRWGESPESFAARCAAALPALRPLTDAHLRAAFGRRVDETRWSRMIEDGRELRAQLGRAVPWWRRWLGALNPYSWVLTR